MSLAVVGATVVEETTVAIEGVSLEGNIADVADVAIDLVVAAGLAADVFAAAVVISTGTGAGS